MSEQKTEEEVKPSKNVSDEYLRGYRAGYNKGVDKTLRKMKEKKSNLEIEVKKEVPIKKEVTAKEIKEPEIVRPQNDNSRITIITAIIIAIILAGVVYFVFIRRNTKPSE